MSFSLAWLHEKCSANSKNYEDARHLTSFFHFKVQKTSACRSTISTLIKTIQQDYTYSSVYASLSFLRQPFSFPSFKFETIQLRCKSLDSWSVSSIECFRRALWTGDPTIKRALSTRHTYTPKWVTCKLRIFHILNQYLRHIEQGNLCLWRYYIRNYGKDLFKVHIFESLWFDIDGNLPCFHTFFQKICF